MPTDTITSRPQIPPAPLYVLSNDAYMSGWGNSPSTNTIILPCDSLTEAHAVADYAKSRPEQKRVRIVANKPRLRDGITYSLLTRDIATAWYPAQHTEHTQSQRHA